ncbi:MAG TPA: VCBS repeat-containing protein, partial [Pyrinomonadaceae bacterium]
MRNLVIVAILLAVVTVTDIPRRSVAKESVAQTPSIVFTEVPPSQSKITWVHDNARSEVRHLPETCGGGGLFFDYDNDGWMDVYLVNSGPSDFFTPKIPLRNALYRNNGDGSFTDVTDKAGVAC